MPLRILHVSPYPEAAWAYGGIPRVLGPLTRGLAARGHRVTVCTTDVQDRRSRWRATAPIDGVEVRVFPNVSNAAAYRWQLFLPRGMSRWLERAAGDFDVAHLHACHNLPGVYAATALRRAGVPWVLTPHGTAPRIERRRLAKLLFDRLLGRRVLAAAAAVVALSRAEARTLHALGVDERRVTVIPNPMRLEELDDPPPRGRFRRRLGLGEGPLVVFLGKLTPRKRADDLLAAGARLPSTVRLAIAGNDMGEGRRLRRLARRLGIAGRTVFTGLLRGDERLEALADADVVVSPSEHEVFGLVPLEALLCGTPVVVADDSGCGEIVARAGGGAVVPVGDVAELARALGALLADSAAARRRAREAARRVRRLVDPAGVVRATEDLYLGVLGFASRLAEAA